MTNRGIPTINLGALGQSKDQAPLPKPDGALYRYPNPDDTRKACRNCIFFVEPLDRCVLHARDQEVTDQQLCGYHVFGVPHEEWVEHAGMMPLKPELSGLRWVGPGAACASCKFYRRQDSTNGLCVGMSNPDTRQPPVQVKSRGWCARYEGM